MEGDWLWDVGPIVHRDEPTPHDHQVWAHESKVHQRIIRDVDSGKVIDDCIPELVADEKLFRALPDKRNIRVELVMKNAAKWFRHAGPDISEIYTPPRVAQEAGPT